MRIFLVSSVLVLSAMLSACANQTNYIMATANQFTSTNYAAADQLLTALKGKISTTQPVIVATIVDINHLEQSSTLGRLISEQVSSRFSQAGVQVIEMKFRENVFMKQDQGELMLTRDVKSIANEHDAQAVLVGTYAESRNFVYVTLKVVQPQTDLVLAVDNYTLPKDSEVTTMLHNHAQDDN
jgi:TolB-like protein